MLSFCAEIIVSKTTIKRQTRVQAAINIIVLCFVHKIPNDLFGLRHHHFLTILSHDGGSTPMRWRTKKS